MSERVCYIEHMSRKFFAVCIGIMIAIPLFIWFMYSREPSTESFSRVPERLLAPLKYHPLFSPASGNIKKFDVWQKYTDPSARFTFYYPPGWKLLVKGDTLSLASAERSLLLRDPRDKTGALPEISITLLPNPTKQSLEQFARVYESGWFTIYRSVKPSTAANKPALVFSDIGAPSGHTPLRAVFIDATRFVLLIAQNDREGTKTSEQSALVEDILSTLTF
jgi:hypothetical protein